jgi:hypothetical protein
LFTSVYPPLVLGALLASPFIHLDNTGWHRETGKFEIIRKNTKETYKTLFDPENVFYKSGNFIRHHFLKIMSVKCYPFRCTHSEDFA